jgi:hypothetical protein
MAARIHSLQADRRNEFWRDIACRLHLPCAHRRRMICQTYGRNKVSRIAFAKAMPAKHCPCRGELD